MNPSQSSNGNSQSPNSVDIQNAIIVNIRPLLDSLRDDFASLRGIVNGMRDTESSIHQAMLDELKEIKEQTKKTNGRVSELERREILNALVRYLLGAAILALLAAEGNKIINILGL